MANLPLSLMIVGNHNQTITKPLRRRAYLYVVTLLGSSRPFQTIA